MIVLILFMLPAALYAVAWSAAWQTSSRPRPEDPRSGPAPAPLPPAPQWGLAAAIVLHGMSLAWPWDQGGFHFGFAKALSGMFWIGLVMLWLEGRRAPLAAMHLLLLPLAALALILPLAFPGTDFGAVSQRPLFVPHLVMGTLAYGVLMLGALQALLMLWAQRDLQRLDRPRASGLLGRVLGGLPPLLVLERVLFRFIWIGFGLLLLTTLSGMLFSEEVFGRPFRFEHKTVFSLLSLAFFGVLLTGRVVRGWRGRIAMRFTLWGFLILLLAYLGTRFVLEVVLQRY
jgi:ABC-type uncharacterized transport system permease subunit